MFGFGRFWKQRRLSALGNELLQQSGARGLESVRVIPSSSQSFPVDFERTKSRLTMTVADQIFDTDERWLLEARVPLLIRLFEGVYPGIRARADIYDGSWKSDDALCFCTNHDDALLVPDPDFFNSRGYETRRQAAPHLPRWKDRSSDIVWRGATTGWSFLNGEKDHMTDRRASHRVQFCRALRDVAGVDAKIYWVVQSHQPDQDREGLAAEGLMGERIAELEWGNRKFALDIDGNTNTWSNLFVRLLFGCCMIKVASPNGFRQWYYDRLIPWTHYVPVAADLHDLVEKIGWCRSHPDECGMIAAEGQRLAMSLTFEGEMEAATARINQRFGEARTRSMAGH